MQKYQEHLLQSVHTQLEEWFTSSTDIPHENIYRFVHAIKGTSATIGLPGMYEAAAALLDNLAPEDQTSWDKESLRKLFYGLMHAVNEPGITLENDSASGALPSTLPVSDEFIPLIVVLDDDPTLLMYVKDELERFGWSVLATVDPKKAVTYFHDQNPDCFITDLHFPETNGFQVIETLLEKIRKQLIPTTVISVDGGKKTRLQAYRMGADDFMSKPLDLEELIARIQRQLDRKKRFDSMLFVDELTGAFNRKYMYDAYARLIAELNRSQEPFSVAVLDLDFFKQVNDRYGHLVGDAVLAGFAAFIRAHKRSSDMLIRYGGEEFILLLPHTNAATAKKLLERILEQFALHRFDSHLGPFSVTFSGGVTEVTQAEEPLEAAVKRADQALYHAKNNGRRRIENAIEYAEATAPARKKLKAAIVDDDTVIREMVAEYLTSHVRTETDFDMDIRSFQDGESFMGDSWHNGEEPMLVILDGLMPGIDGIDVLQQLRALPRSEKYMIIMLTGRNDEKDVVKALQLGADDYVTKPFSFNELKVRIERLIGRMP